MIPVWLAYGQFSSFFALHLGAPLDGTDMRAQMEIDALDLGMSPGKTLVWNSGAETSAKLYLGLGPVAQNSADHAG